MNTIEVLVELHFRLLPRTHWSVCAVSCCVSGEQKYLIYQLAFCEKCTSVNTS